MSLMLWGEWEENGYHDSYFYAAYWDVDAQECISHQTGATAYAGGEGRKPTIDWTPEELENARKWLAARIFGQLKAANLLDVNQPENIVKGQRVRLLEPHQNQKFESAEITCPSCDGLGYWQNPRNEADKRECFKCKGAKKIQGKGAKLKGQWEKFDTGVKGEAKFDATAFGRFYDKGYNRPGRHNRSVTVLLDDGRWMKAPLKKLALDQDPMSDTELQKQADELSLHMDPKSMLTRHGGWWDYNAAASLMHKQRGTLPAVEPAVIVVCTDDGIDRGPFDEVE